MAVLRSSLNALHNCQNPNQTSTKKVLCVCSAGLLRSPTAAKILTEKFGYNTRAVGVYDYALIQISEVLVQWADEVLFMEENHYDSVVFRNSQDWIDSLNAKCHILGIPDDHDWGSPELEAIILEKYLQTQKKT